MEENRLKGLQKAKRRRDDSSNDNSATSLLTDAPQRIFPDSYVSSFSPSELEPFPWTMSYTDMLASEIDDCNSESLPNARKRTLPSEPHHSQKSAEAMFENQGFGTPLVCPQILADRVQNSVENLQVFYERLSDLVGLEGHGYGDSGVLLQAKEQREISQLPNDSLCGDSVPTLQVWNRDRQLGLANVVSPEDYTFGAGGMSPDDGSWQWMSQITQGSLTAESAVSRTEGGELKYTEGKVSASTVDLKDLLSSLQLLLSVLKNHEGAKKISGAKMQALRKKKEALRLAKQQYRDKYKQQPVAECFPSVSAHD